MILQTSQSHPVAQTGPLCHMFDISTVYSIHLERVYFSLFEGWCWFCGELCCFSSWHRADVVYKRHVEMLGSASLHWIISYQWHTKSILITGLTLWIHNPINIFFLTHLLIQNPKNEIITYYYLATSAVSICTI